jgi:hypothetical protein
MDASAPLVFAGGDQYFACLLMSARHLQSFFCIFYFLLLDHLQMHFFVHCAAA